MASGKDPSSSSQQQPSKPKPQQPPSKPQRTLKAFFKTKPAVAR
jgi:hypothetical protein